MRARTGMVSQFTHQIVLLLMVAGYRGITKFYILSKLLNKCELLINKFIYGCRIIPYPDPRSLLPQGLAKLDKYTVTPTQFLGFGNNQIEGFSTSTTKKFGNLIITSSQPVLRTKRIK